MRYRSPIDWLEDYGDDTPVIDSRGHMRELAERAGAAPDSESAPLAFAAFMQPTVDSISEVLAARRTWRPRVGTGVLNGLPATVASLSAGASRTVMIFEEFIAGGARTILIGGAVGSLQPQVTIGDYVIPTSARREEGTSFHYAGPEYEATANGLATQALLEAARVSPRRAHAGRVWTTDAPYREFRGKATRYATEGDLGVEMETSAVMTVAAVRGIDVGLILTVSDHVFDPYWGNIFGTSEFDANCVELGQVMLAAARKLIANSA